MLRSGSICASLLYKYLTTTDDAIDKSDKYQKNLLKVKVLSETFANYGGILSKISQMINYAYGVHKSDVFSECKPVNQKKTRDFLESEMLEFDDDIISYETSVYKSGSVGQVHKAIFKDNREIVIKVQYVGLKEIFDNDIYILDSIANYLFTDLNIKDAMKDIKKQLYEELDYRIEARNQTHMKELWKDDAFIKIPDLIPELCNEKILTMEYIAGVESLNDFLDRAAGEEIKHIGDLIIRFMFVNLFKHGLIYTDVHYGNFLIKDRKTLYILDFGSVHYIDKKVHSYLGCMLNAVYIGDKEQFTTLWKNWVLSQKTNESVRNRKIICGSISIYNSDRGRRMMSFNSVMILWMSVD
jgi:predicted unusual protein kinase regulating ubiquinone biosynthesis (AarF/ABC1/UbiB family)